MASIVVPPQEGLDDEPHRVTLFCWPSLSELLSLIMLTAILASGVYVFWMYLW